MSQISDNNKRIAKNTIILYARTLFVLAVKLYTSRLILKYLGVTDYGIYNIVASFIAMFTLLNGALTTSIQRFLTYSLGEKNVEKVRDVFSASLLILLFLSLIIIIVAETVGLWYVNNKLNIPLERMEAANWVYQFSVITFVMQVITVPYNSILTAYENFKAFAYFDILNALLSLFLVISIGFVADSLDALIYYGAGLLFIAAAIRFLYSAYCHKQYVASHFSIVKDKKLYKKLFSFSFYSFFGNMGNVIGEGGINIVINIFFGVALNATRGISTQVSNAVGGFIRSFTTTLNPQITKNYAEGNVEQYTKLVYYSARFSFLLLTVFLIPIMVNIHYILRLWLTEIPPYSEVFVQLMLLQSLIHVLFNPITTIVNATGNIKLYQIGTFIILISNIIFIYIVYVFGCAAYVGITVQCIVTFFQLLFSVFVMQKTTKIRAIPFLKNVVVPVSLIYILCLICACGCNYALESINWHPLLSIIMSVFTTSFICFYIGINKDLRNKILFSLKNKIHI
ncbi:lipopolysaccharide biosynthesis protein [Xylanibacter caecicola]|uniref:lipopolysaccharide biosynthesis protein n=1 Tax=Xylanibacter caecicola TaxID=2736294 RepID=UPI0025829C9C|nr:MATE family efflux transporter [Xylanibacter caecicola]